MSTVEHRLTKLISVVSRLVDVLFVTVASSTPYSVTAANQCADDEAVTDAEEVPLQDSVRVATFIHNIKFSGGRKGLTKEPLAKRRIVETAQPISDALPAASTSSVAPQAATQNGERPWKRTKRGCRAGRGTRNATGVKRPSAFSTRPVPAKDNVQATTHPSAEQDVPPNAESREQDGVEGS